MRRALLLLLALLTLALPALAEPFPDLSAHVPEGSFLPAGTPPQRGENSYRSENITITLSTQRAYGSDVFVAEIRLRSMAHLQRVLAKDRWGRGSESLRAMAERGGAILAMTGDYANLLSKGLVVANGELLRDSANRLRDNALVYPDGRMACFGRGELDVAEALKEPVWQAFLFGPSLLDAQGKAVEQFQSNVKVSNPRSVIGWYGPGHFCFVVADGRQKGQRGLSLKELAAFMEGLGCLAAYNLDGGQSAMLWYGGEMVNSPYKGGRWLQDILIIKE